MKLQLSPYNVFLNAFFNKDVYLGKRIEMLSASTLQLLRVKFSFFLMPVYWFALSQVSRIHILHAAIIFIILHLFLYPASNAYNSYIDRDTGSIGAVKDPLQPTRQLFYVSVLLDIAALLAGLLISFYFTLCIAMFIVASRAYSYRGIRLKKYPLISFFTAILFQGSVVYFMVYHGSSIPQTLKASWPAMIASALLTGCFYPLTQVFQHEQDREDGVRSISIMLGYRGTFIFSALMYMAAMIVLGYYFAANLELDRFLVLTGCMFPVMVYFLWWFGKVFKNIIAANYKNSLRMNIIMAVCMNTAFIILLMLK